MSNSAMAGDEAVAKNDPDDRPIKKGDEAARWLAAVKASGARESKWRKKGLDIVARYRAEEMLELYTSKPTEKKINILYSNTDVLLSHLCVDLGTPDVRRMFPRPGRKTQIARLSAEVLEKTMVAEGHACDSGKEFEDAIEDAVLPGRGQVWLDLDEVESPKPDMTWFKAEICHVDWDMFRTGPARKWREVPWVARGHLFDKEDLEDKFGDFAKDIPLNYELENNSEQTKQSVTGTGRESIERALVWEIWDKHSQCRLYVAEDFPKILRSDVDPFRLEGFFPCPEPLYMIKTTKTMIPVPLFVQYEHQANELNRLTTRSNRLTESLKYCGLYGALGDDTLKDIGNLEDGEFIPFKNFAALQQSGGLAQAFMVRDISQIVPALQAVDAKIDLLVQRIYEISGISDIMRGESNPDTTATAERFKARFGSQRSNRRSRQVQRFVRNAYRIKAELVAEHYSPEQLSEITGIPLPTKLAQQQAQQQLQMIQGQAAQMQAAGMPAPQPDPQMVEDLQAAAEATPWEDVGGVIRSNARRLFMVDVETDDTAADDDVETQEQALAFMGAMFTTLQSIGPAVAAKPELLPLAKELVTFTANAFKVGQAFDDAINDVFDKLAKAPPPPAAPADPVAAAQAALVQVQTQKAQADIGISQQKAQADLQAKTQAAAIDVQIKQIELQIKKMELQIKQEEVQTRAVGNQIDLQQKVQQHETRPIA